MNIAPGERLNNQLATQLDGIGEQFMSRSERLRHQMSGVGERTWKVMREVGTELRRPMWLSLIGGIAAGVAAVWIIKRR